MLIDSNTARAKIYADAERFAGVIALIRYVVGCIAGCFALWLIFDGLSKVIGEQDADGISAFAKVVEALNIGSILGYLLAGGAVIAWRRERTGKKRAIREKSRYQKMAEQDDPNRTSSGLSATGGTPREDDDE